MSLCWWPGLDSEPFSFLTFGAAPFCAELSVPLKVGCSAWHLPHRLHCRLRYSLQRACAEAARSSGSILRHPTPQSNTHGCYISGLPHLHTCHPVLKVLCKAERSQSSPRPTESKLSLSSRARHNRSKETKKVAHCFSLSRFLPQNALQNHALLPEEGSGVPHLQWWWGMICKKLFV